MNFEKKPKSTLDKNWDFKTEITEDTEASKSVEKSAKEIRQQITGYHFQADNLLEVNKKREIYMSENRKVGQRRTFDA